MNKCRQFFNTQRKLAYGTSFCGVSAMRTETRSSSTMKCSDVNRSKSLTVSNTTTNCVHTISIKLGDELSQMNGICSILLM